ncbi:MAG: LysM peptidoglycan-binding domain-containing protein [Anaerolineae bacterium]|nr:LysM peptidoglycan-binding domain-containing protein [Anaerolineae bacterium]
MRKSFHILVIAICGCFSACVRTQPQIIVITSTPPPETSTTTPQVQNQAVIPMDPQLTLTHVSTGATSQPDVLSIPEQYEVQPGDTLSAIAALHGVSIETLLSVNNLADPNILSVGQIINLPMAPSEQTNSFKIIPDSRLVRGPGSREFDIATFINQQPGFIRTATDIVDEVQVGAVEVVSRVSLEFSVDARLLLALLEYRSKWLSQNEIDETRQLYPIQGVSSPDGFDRSGLYKQLSWTANQLNRGYYGWKHQGLKTLEFDDGTRLSFASDLNAATVGLQYFLALNNNYLTWLQQVAMEGFYQIYTSYFGDPFLGAIEPLLPNPLTQPALTLPFSSGETWFFTGGAHGGWGSGSAWSAVDFAPPDDRPDGSPSCYISEFWATAVASGVITRSENGTVILDLDGDGDESTGWSVLYLHLASEGRIATGRIVQVGDQIGKPSCEGGFSNGTHIHIARRYNGEWIPVTCDGCSPNNLPPFLMSGWTMYGLINQEYQGYMIKGNERRNAEQGRLAPDNRVSW